MAHALPLGTNAAARVRRRGNRIRIANLSPSAETGAGERHANSKRRLDSMLGRQLPRSARKRHNGEQLRARDGQRLLRVPAAECSPLRLAGDTIKCERATQAASRAGARSRCTRRGLGRDGPVGHAASESLAFRCQQSRGHHVRPMHWATTDLGSAMASTRRAGAQTAYADASASCTGYSPTVFVIKSSGSGNAWLSLGSASALSQCGIV